MCSSPVQCVPFLLLPANPGFGHVPSMCHRQQKDVMQDGEREISVLLKLLLLHMELSLFFSHGSLSSLRVSSRDAPYLFMATFGFNVQAAL